MEYKRQNNKYLYALIKLLEIVVFCTFSTMLVLVFIQVLNRYIFGLPIFFTEELARMMLVWSVMLGLPIVTYYYQNITVDLFEIKSERLLKYKNLSASIISITFCLVLAWYGYQFMDRVSMSLSPTLGVSRAWFVGPIPIGAFLTAIILVSQMKSSGNK